MGSLKKWGGCKTWTLDRTRGLDYGLEFGLEFGLELGHAIKMHSGFCHSDAQTSYLILMSFTPRKK
jgi:hypothetical protein